MGTGLQHCSGCISVHYYYDDCCSSASTSNQHLSISRHANIASCLAFKRLSWEAKLPPTKTTQSCEREGKDMDIYSFIWQRHGCNVQVLRLLRHLVWSSKVLIQSTRLCGFDVHQARAIGASDAHSVVQSYRIYAHWKSEQWSALFDSRATHTARYSSRNPMWSS